MRRVTGLLRRSFVKILLVMVGLMILTSPAAAAEKELDGAPAPVRGTESVPVQGRQPVACVMFGTQQANRLALSVGSARTFGDLSQASTEICSLTEEQPQSAAASDQSRNEPLSVTLLDITAAPSVTQQWWWIAWPWMMLLLALLSLIGYVLVRRHQFKNEEPGE